MKATQQRKKKSQASRPEANKKRKQFTLEAPEAEDVLLIGSFCDWEAGYRMKKDNQGLWKVMVSLEPGRHEYRFVVDGQWQNDPRAVERTVNPFGAYNDIVVV